MTTIRRPANILILLTTLIFLAPFTARADCAAAPDSLNFSSIIDGQPEILTFTLTNTSGVRVQDDLEFLGSPQVIFGFPDGDYATQSYDLEPGEQMEVRVIADPYYVGPIDVLIDLGAAAGGCDEDTVALHCFYQPAPQAGEVDCTIMPVGEMEFPHTVVGDSSSRKLWIINSGGEYPQQNAGVLEGELPRQLGAFHIPWGSDYQITYHQTWDVFFRPEEPGRYEVDLDLPDLCPSLPLRGIGLAQGTFAEQSHTELDLGLVQLGSSAVKQFTVLNLGTDPLPLSLPTTCGPFTVVGGGFTRILQSGEEEAFFVRFTPETVGQVSCELDLGTPAVQALTLSGSGLENLGLPDVVGIWFDQTGQMNQHQTTQPNETVTAYLMIQNPSAQWGASGWEACVEMTGNGTALTWDLEGEAFNALSPPCFAVGIGGSPIAGSSPLLLGTLTFLQPDPDTPTYFHIHPVGAPSLPGRPLYADGADPGRLIPLTPASSDEAIPVAAVNEASTDTPQAQARTHLAHPQPNPFNPSTTLSFELAAAGRARLVLFDLQGRRVRTLVDGELPAGPHACVWDGRDDAGRAATSGVYLARLTAGDQVRRVRLTLLK